MAQTFRVPPTLVEFAQDLDTPLAQTIRSSESINLETVIQIRSQWGSEWATNIIDKILRDATMVYKEGDTGTLIISEWIAKAKGLV